MLSPLHRIFHTFIWKKGRPARRPRALLLVILAAWALRVLGLGSRPLWVDEAFSLWMTRPAPPHLIAKAIQIDQHPPLYYLTLKAWVGLFGSSEWAMRSLSAFWGLLTVPLAYVTARGLLRDARAALLVAALVALSPFHVRYAQEARMYTMLAFWGLASLYLTTRLPPHASRLTPHALRITHYSRRTMLFPLLLGTSAALAALTHGLGLLVPLTVALSLVLIRPPRRYPLIALAAFALLWLPWLPAFIHQARGVVHRFWIPWPTWRDVLDALHTFHAVYLPGPTWLRWAVDAFFLVLAGLGIWSLAGRALRCPHPSPLDRRRAKGCGAFLLSPLPTLGERRGRQGERGEGHGNAAVVLLVLFWLAPLVIELALSPLRPVFQPRTLIWTTFPYYVLVVTGVRALGTWRARGLAPLAVATILLVQVLGLRGWYASPPPEQWDRAVSIVQAHAQPDDLLLFNAAWTQLPFEYYATRAGLDLEAHGVPVDIARARELEPLTTPADVARIERLVAGRSRVWLIYSHEWYTDPDGITRRALERHFVLARAWDLPGIKIRLYTLPQGE